MHNPAPFTLHHFTSTPWSFYTLAREVQWGRDLSATEQGWRQGWCVWVPHLRSPWGSNGTVSAVTLFIDPVLRTGWYLRTIGWYPSFQEASMPLKVWPPNFAQNSGVILVLASETWTNGDQQKLTQVRDTSCFKGRKGCCNSTECSWFYEQEPWWHCSDFPVSQRGPPPHLSKHFHQSVWKCDLGLCVYVCV